MSRSGFVSVVGRPNVGKSTLVNALVGTKVVITSPRPQTTRNTVRGVLTLEDRDTQVVFVDTPGVHKPRNALGDRLNRMVYGSLAESDINLFVLDARQAIGPGDRLIADRLREAGAPVVVVVNKVDVADPGQVLSQLDTAGEWDFGAYVPISALRSDGLDRVIDEIVVLLPEGPFYFPPDMKSDQPEDLLIAELVREKFLARLHEELPHSVAVIVDGIETRENGTVFVPAIVFVERESQKGMVIGKGGSLISQVGREARAELERVFAAKVYLDIRVKVEKDWQRRDTTLDRLGFS